MSTLVAYRLVASHRATPPFEGQGAWLFGGRWNSNGRSAVYVAESEALALLEVLVHIADSYQLNRYRLFQMDLPAALVHALALRRCRRTGGKIRHHLRQLQSEMAG